LQQPVEAYTLEAANVLAEQIFAQFSPQECRQALSGSGYAQYQQDPVGFGEQVLGEWYTDDVKAMMESVRDFPITIAISANATGKTHGAARVAAWWYKAHPGAQVYTTAAPPEENLKRLLWGEIGHIQELHESLFAGDRVNVLHIERNAKEFITGVRIPASGSPKQREAKFSGKHAPYLLFVVDEGDAVPPEVYQGIEACMSGGHTRLLIMFNPRQPLGRAYQMQREGIANVVHLSAFSHPNVKTGKDVIPGAVDRDTTVRRINKWCRLANAQEQIPSDAFELPEFLVGAQARMESGGLYPPLVAGTYLIENPAFAYMVLGQYPAAGTNQLIHREWIDAARSRYDLYVAAHGLVPPEGTWGKQGVDVAEFGQDLSASCLRYGGFVPPLITWGGAGEGMDPVATGDRAADIYHESTRITVAYVDATGVGSGTAPQMRRRACNAHGIKVSEKSKLESEEGRCRLIRDQLWWSGREWLRTSATAMLPPDDYLIEELSTPTYEIKNGKIMVMDKDTMKETLGRSPDKADAFNLTFGGGEMFDSIDLEGTYE